MDNKKSGMVYEGSSKSSLSSNPIRMESTDFISQDYPPSAQNEECVEFPPFTLYEEQVIGYVLLEAIGHLKLLKYCLPFPNFDWSKVVGDKMKYKDLIFGKVNDKVFPPYSDYESSGVFTIQKELHSFNYVMQQTLESILRHEGYNTLLAYLSELVEMNQMTVNLAVENEKLKNMLWDESKRLLEQEANNCFLLDKPVEEFDTNDEKVNDTRVILSIEKRYITEWEKARVRQNEMKIKIEEDALYEQIFNLKNRFATEIRVGIEIATALDNDINELERSIYHWNCSYKNDMEKIENELQELYNEKIEMENKMRNLIIKFQNHKDTVEEISAFFDNLRLQRILQGEHMFVTKIQTWWREYSQLKQKQTLPLKNVKKK